MGSENFVVIPNLFLSENRQKLTPDELRIYYLIVQNELKWFDNRTKITINQLASEVNLRKNKHQNNNAIKQVLFELKNKNAISFEDNELANYSPLNISFKDIKHYTSLTGFTKGYEMIPFSTFKEARNSEEFFTLCLIMKNKSGEIAYSTFATLLGICDKSAKTLIQNMLDAGLINKQSGIYYLNAENLPRQEINKYEVRSQENVEQVDNVIELFPDRESISDYSTSIVNETNIRASIDWGNWNKKKPNRKYEDLKSNDYYLYLLQKDMDTEFRNQCEKRIYSLKGKFDFSKWERLAKEKLNKMEQSKYELEKTNERAKELFLQRQILSEKKPKMKKTDKHDKNEGFDITTWFDDDADERVKLG